MDQQHLDENNYPLKRLANREDESYEPEVASNTEERLLVADHRLEDDRLSKRPSLGRVLVRESSLPLLTLKVLIHAASLGFSAVIFWLCGSNIYFRDTDTPCITSILNAWEFVAALYTAIISASLAAMAVYHL